MGRRGCVVGEVAFDRCRVPADHLLGDENSGGRIMVGMFNFERIILGGSGLGVARSAFDIAQAHAQTREAFGEKIGCKQLVWSQIAGMSCRLDAAELLTYRAAKLYDSGVAGKNLMKPAAMAKLVATETATYCADRTVQILGGDGITKEFGRAEQIYRDARALPIVGGTSEMAKYLIAVADLPSIKLNL
jgi:alkylation response protein AidB-like acyl-CoA dehydrogenase